MAMNGFINQFSNRKTILLLNVILGILLALSILFLIRHILSFTLQHDKSAVVREEKGPVMVRRALQDYEVIFKNNPFGFPAGELKPLTPVSAAVPSVKQSDMVLIGTVAGRRDLSYAIFSDKTGQQDVFRVGDQVFGLGVLDKVETDKVILNAKGRLTEIQLSDITTVKEIRSTATQSSGFGRKTGASTYVIDQQKVQEAIEKPDQLMTDARFVPYMVGGDQKGFVLREVKYGGIYHSLGLQNGDVLLRINEFAISDPETALRAFTALRGIDRAQLDILRHGSRMTLTYQIR